MVVVVPSATTASLGSEVRVSLEPTSRRGHEWEIADEGGGAFAPEVIHEWIDLLSFLANRHELEHLYDG